MRDNNLIGNIVFAARSSKTDDSLVSYAKQLISYPNNTVCSYVITNVSYKKAEEWDMLQLADVCASSIFHAHEPDDYGFRHPCFQSNLTSHMYRHGENTINYGLKYYPENADYKSINDIPKPCKN